MPRIDMNQMRVRADLRLAPPVSGGHGREELIAFAMYCAARMTRDLAGIDDWDLYVVGGLDGSASAVVRAHVGTAMVEARASACDPANAIWNAMCQVEQPLRVAATVHRAA